VTDKLSHPSRKHLDPSNPNQRGHSEPPDQRADALLCGAMKGGERVEPMHQPFGMHPAQRVLSDVELTGIIGDNHRLAQEAVVRHATPQRAFGLRRGALGPVPRMFDSP